MTFMLKVFLYLEGSALRCYVCTPNETSISAGKPSCRPESLTCQNATHCLSMRRTLRDSKERTYKSCADDVKCVSAHTACLKLMNSSQIKSEVCHAHCCETDLCNIDVHKNLQTQAGNRGDTNGYSVPVPLTATMTSLFSMSLHLFGMT